MLVFSFNSALGVGTCEDTVMKSISSLLYFDSLIPFSIFTICLLTLTSISTSLITTTINITDLDLYYCVYRIMLGPLNIVLEDFGVSSRNGFLPDRLPLMHLSNPYYEEWEHIVDCLPQLLNDNTIRNKVDKLSLLSTSKLGSEREWQRAYVLLSFMTHAYIWGGVRPSEVCLLYRLFNPTNKG